MKTTKSKKTITTVNINDKDILYGVILLRVYNPKEIDKCIYCNRKASLYSYSLDYLRFKKCKYVPPVVSANTKNSTPHRSTHVNYRNCEYKRTRVSQKYFGFISQIEIIKYDSILNKRLYYDFKSIDLGEKIYFGASNNYLKTILNKKRIFSEKERAEEYLNNYISQRQIESSLHKIIGKRKKPPNTYFLQNFMISRDKLIKSGLEDKGYWLD